MEAEDLAMPRYDYESPLAGWWREQGEYVAPVLMAVAFIGLCAWVIVAASVDKKACVALAARCEAGEIVACVEGSGCSSDEGAVCESRLRTAALRAAKGKD